MDFKNRSFWLLLTVVLVGAFIYRNFFASSGGGEATDLGTREMEISNLFQRIPSYPGSQNPEGSKVVTSEGAVIMERRYPVKATYDQVKQFYVKEGPGIGWEPIGEQRNVPGFTSPVHIFRSGEYHLLLNVEAKGARLRITWSPDGDPLISRKILLD